MLERMKEILKQNGLCVLATCLDDKPHCSLMAYITDPEARFVYMVTQKSTKKWTNVMRNPQVSLLVDTRMHAASEKTTIQALTVSGIAEPVEDEPIKKSILERIAAGHPHLKEISRRPDAEVVAVKVESMLLLDGVSDAYFEEVG
jgi:nitroimidazol reductase NimA-like FMN-containing flavoprotein (pyridoxamine 5'-phosphate oxidase superfamily)